MKKSLVLAASVLLLAAACDRPNASGNRHGGAKAQALAATVDRTSGPFVPGTVAAAAPTGCATCTRTGRFAALADRGELLAYPTVVPPSREGALVWHRVQISEDHALRAIASGHLEFRAPSGQMLKFLYSRHVEHPNGDWTWIGHSDDFGANGQQAIVTFGEKAVFGSIGLPDGNSLELTVRNDVAWIVETDRTRLHKSPGLLSPPADDARVPRQAAAAAAVAGESAPVGPQAAAASSGSVVDIAIGYTPGLVSTYGSQSGAVTRLSFLVDVTNEAYANSQVDMRIRLVHTLLVNYSDSVSNNTALNEVTGSDGSNSVAVPAALQPLRAARDQYGADLVALARPFRDSTSDGCGVAWILGGGQTPITARSERFGYAAISDGSDSGSFCRAETLAHELGHNMGQTHNTEDSSQPGAHAYSYGYRESSGSGFYTVMAYAAGGASSRQVAVRYFANPNVLYQGRPTGVANAADNVRSMNLTMPIIATFRAGVVPLNGPVRNDIDGNGRSDFLWHNIDLQRFDWWSMNGASRGAVGSDFIAGQYRVAATGDFNGDGRTDLVWRDQTKLWLWQAEPAGGFSIHFIADYPAGGWQVIGAQDLDRDGRADLLWHNPTLQRMDWWIMNGASRLSVGSKFIAAQYSVAGVGDFNGDGRGDVLWRDANMLWMWQADATGFSIVFVANNPPNPWRIVGTGDINADGKTDIFWHNTTLQQMDWWLMDGANRLGIGSKGVSSQYRPAAFGDFNGDGRADVLWHDNAKTSLWVWQADGAGGFSILSAGAYPPASWDVLNF